jgi:hypothetical protein
MPVGVPVGGRQADDDLGADGDCRVADLHRLDRVAECRVGNGGVVAEALLDGRGDFGGVGSELGELLGVAQQATTLLPMRLAVVSWPATIN